MVFTRVMAVARSLGTIIRLIGIDRGLVRLLFNFSSPPEELFAMFKKTCRCRDLLTPAENVHNLLIPNAQPVSAPGRPRPCRSSTMCDIRRPTWALASCNLSSSARNDQHIQPSHRSLGPRRKPGSGHFMRRVRVLWVVVLCLRILPFP